MSKNSRTIILLLTFLLLANLFSLPAYSQTPVVAPLRPEVTADPTPGRGFVPPRLDLSHLTGQHTPEKLQSFVLPTRWDWREQGAVTSIKNQGSCGSCYAFASLANIESKLLIDGEAAYNFSENNAKECNWYQTSCDGGSYDQMVDWFSKAGAVLEACDPYVAGDVACNSGCTYVTTLLDWRIITDDAIPATAVLQQYIYDHGPVFTTLYAGDGFDPSWNSEFNGYDGSYTLYYAGAYPPNHAVLIVGWDDDLVHGGGTGGWIVKNSWGSAWGGTCGYGAENGYFTIAYGSASIGKYSSYIYRWQDYDSDGQLLFYDEGGATTNWGYGSTTAWGLCKFVQPATSYVTRVEFWTSDITTDIDVFVYDDFDGSNLGNLLSSKGDLAFDEAGYHSVALDSPPEITTGEDFYVAVKFTNASYGYPVCCSNNGPAETGTTYMNLSGGPGAWTDMGFSYGDDVAIRARTSVDLGVSVGDEWEPTSHEFGLSDNYPNPFNPSTTICYSLRARAQVEISIINLLGQRVATLVNSVVPAGEHYVTWNGEDKDGNPAASGLYLYQLRTGDFVESKKMILLR